MNAEKIKESQLDEAYCLSKTEYEKLQMHVQQELVKHGIYIADLNGLSIAGLINILEKLLDSRSKPLNNCLKEVIKCDLDYDGPLDHDAIDANSIDFHRFAVEAIDAIREDRLMHEIIKLMQHAAAKGKIADLSKDPEIEEEILAESEAVSAEEPPKPFFHVLEEEKEKREGHHHEIINQPGVHKHYVGDTD